MHADSLDASVRDAVRRYYGETLTGSRDLKTTACCSTEALPRHVRPLAAMLHHDVTSRFYGCGSPIPPALRGRTVLDLGCGTGRDTFLVSALVGSAGRVIGIDMTPEQLEVAQRHRAWHADRFGLPASNVDFRLGHAEDLRAAGIEDGSVDVVISNCVINLSPDKRRVFSEILRVLAPGGELYFADVFADRRLPEEARRDETAVGECLGGALYVEDFRRLMAQLGVADVRSVARSRVDVTDDSVRRVVGPAAFWSITYRAFKLDLEDRCEDYGQVARYLGTIEESPGSFTLDDHHVFETGRPVLVCRNTADMLARSRYGEHFRIDGDARTHYGIFGCAPAGAGESAGGACC